MTVIDKAAASGQRIEIRVEGSFASLYLDGSLVQGGSSAPLPAPLAGWPRSRRIE